MNELFILICLYNVDQNIILYKVNFFFLGAKVHYNMYYEQEHSNHQEILGGQSLKESL